MKDGATTHLIIVTSDISEHTNEDSREAAEDASVTVEIFADEKDARAAFKGWKKRTNMDILLVKILDRDEGTL